MNRNLSERKYIIIALMVVVGILYSFRLLYLQVIDDSYILSAESNVLREITVYPNRGNMYDRYGELLVYDEAAYDIMVVPNQVKVKDTAIFCNLMGISDSVFRARMNKARNYSRYKPSVFKKQIRKEEFGYIQEQLYKYPGFYVQSRSLRKYPNPMAAHTLGYIGEVNEQEIKADPYYKMGDYIGKSGIEKFYETELRGRKGSRVVMVDVHNREQGSYRNGKYDTLAVSGKDLYLTIDHRLQAYAEELMKNKMGSIVVIEPATGEILTFVTSPTYDPNLLVGRIRGGNFSLLMKDTLKPLMNRAIMGTYPPGSTFKIVNALVGMQQRVLFRETAYPCQGPASTPIRCTHDHYSPLRLQGAIEQSCNPYFWNVFRSILNNTPYPTVKEAYVNWREHVISLGFGRKFDTDIPFELTGNIPDAGYFDMIYGEGRWNALTVRSLSIGQGEILVTPLQLANLAVIIANKGYYYPPHLIRSIGSMQDTGERYGERRNTTIASEHFDIVTEAMLDVFEGEHGTARWARLEGVQICGKTGTVQNPHGKDHSMFIAFAPRENPGIAMSVIVENSGYGSTWAAPIASLLIEKYLNDTISRGWIEDRIMNANLLVQE